MLALLPGLFWTSGPETTSALRRAGIDHFAALPDRISVWKQAGFSVTPLSDEALHSRVQLTTPGVDRKIQVASATTAPWVNANGWSIRREPGREFWSDLPAGTAALGAAEAFAYDAHATLKIDPADLDEFGKMLQFLRSIPEKTLPDIADFGFIDDGSDNAAEQLNLLSRRNLLYSILRAPDPQLRLNVTTNSDDPHLFAAKVREHLTDSQRSLRVYGSEVVLCRLQGNETAMRVHVLNYGGRHLEGVRLRVRGNWARGTILGPAGSQTPTDYVVADGFSEFSLPDLGVYAVVDLMR